MFNIHILHLITTTLHHKLLWIFINTYLTMEYLCLLYCNNNITINDVWAYGWDVLGPAWYYQFWWSTWAICYSYAIKLLSFFLIGKRKILFVKRVYKKYTDRTSREKVQKLDKRQFFTISQHPNPTKIALQYWFLGQHDTVAICDFYAINFYLFTWLDVNHRSTPTYHP